MGPLKARGSSWGPLKARGAFWGPIEVPLEARASPWVLLESSGGPSGPAGALVGSLWGPPEVFVRPVASFKCKSCSLAPQRLLRLPNRKCLETPA